MTAVTRRALRVYAALSELRGNADVIDALIPFFEPILGVMNGKVFDPHVFSAGVRKLYRWRFTGDIAATFIPRLERKGFLQKVAKVGQAHMWVVRYEETAAGNKEPQEIVTAVEQIIDEFEKFPPRVTDLLSYKKSRDELKDILIRFLVLMDAHGEGAYAPQLGELEPRGEAGELIGQLEEGGRPLDPNDRYMCARFVQYLMRRKREYVPHLTRLASIALLTEVVEDFLKPTDIETRTDLNIVLDAPIALDLLGCSGKALKDDIATIVNALKNIGASVLVFPVSCVEMQRNLRSMLALPVEHRRGYTHAAMLKKEVDLDFVQAVANNPERALANVGVTVRPVDLDSYPNSHRYFTKEQYEDFVSSITWGAQLPAREHDATGLAIVMRLREAKHSSDMFKNRFVMVTRNATFVKNAREYCLQSRMINPMQEGPVVHARELATTAWLRTGLGADETIPRGHLIATCDRVLTVRPEVRQALADQLARITPERLEQFNLLMQDARSVQKLADETLNNAEVISPENAEHLLQVMREATAEELKEKHNAEMQAQKTASEAVLRGKTEEVQRLSNQLTELQTKEARALALGEQQINAIVTDINRRAGRIEVVFASFLLSLGALGLINVIWHVFNGNRIWNFILIIAGAVGFARLFFGLLERPMPALGSLLNVYCRLSSKRRFGGMGLQSALPRLAFKGGRISVGPSSEFIEAKAADTLPAPKNPPRAAPRLR